MSHLTGVLMSLLCSTGRATEDVGVANKVKHAMSQDTKDKARARKEPRTKARKAARRVKQEIAANTNKVFGKPWLKAKRLRAARRHGVAGAA